jgi:hypothetical protein
MYKGYFTKYKFQKCSSDTLLNTHSQKIFMGYFIKYKFQKMFKGYFIKYKFPKNVQGILYWIHFPQKFSWDTLLNTIQKSQWKIVVTLLCSEEEGNNQQMVQTENGCHEDVLLLRNYILCKCWFFLFNKKKLSVIIIKNEPFVMKFVYIFHIIKYMGFF